MSALGLEDALRRDELGRPERAARAGFGSHPQHRGHRLPHHQRDAEAQEPAAAAGHRGRTGAAGAGGGREDPHGTAGQRY